MSKIGFIGLGIMGRPMATNLLTAGYEVHAFDVAERLKSCALSGSDRLETDNIEITLQMYRAKGILTDKEMRSLNDCLAMLLKLTAKYEC